MLCLLLLIQLQCTPNLSSRQSPCLQNTPCVMGGYFAREKRLLLPQTLRDRHIIHVVKGSLDFTIAAYQLRQSPHRVCLSGVVIRCPLNEQQEADMEDDELERSRRQSRAIEEGFRWDQEASEESTQRAGDEMNRPDRPGLCLRPRPLPLRRCPTPRYPLEGYTRLETRLGYSPMAPLVAPISTTRFGVERYR